MLSNSIGKGNDNLAAILNLSVGAPPLISAAGPSIAGALQAARGRSDQSGYAFRS
jgi:hypothetical protein